MASAAAVGSGRCSQADQNWMHRLGGGHSKHSFPRSVSDCARKAYAWFRFHPDKMETCLQKKGMSASCSSCFTPVGAYGAKHCKFACLVNWCSERCIKCLDPERGPSHACAGVDVPLVTQ